MVNKDLASELAAMQDIALALSELEPPARARVLHWLQERFRDQVSPAPLPAAPLATVTPLRVVPPPVTGGDELLSVEALEDLFAPRSRTAAPAPQPPSPPQPITGMLHEFVAEFQDIARAWDGACDAAAENPPRPVRVLSAAS